MGRPGSCWAPGPKRPRAGGQVHGWWGRDQGHRLVWLLPGPWADGPDGRPQKRGPELGPQGAGTPPLPVGLHRGTGLPSQRGLLGLGLRPGFYNLLPGFQGSHKGTLAKDGHQVTISACGRVRPRTSHSTVLHHPQKWLLHQDGDVGPALCRVPVGHQGGCASFPPLGGHY